MIELLTYYVIASALFIGAPAIFFLIVFMPALQNTKGKTVGYKEYAIYGPSTLNKQYEQESERYRSERAYL